MPGYTYAVGVFACLSVAVPRGVRSVDKTIKAWDIRNTSRELTCLHGHTVRLRSPVQRADPGGP